VGLFTTPSNIVDQTLNTGYQIDDEKEAIMA